MARKPDRFERIVMKYIDKGIPDYDGCILTDREVVKLLRRQHRAYVRMIKDHNRSIQSFSDRDIQQAWKDGYGRACMELLNKLAEYTR